MAESVTPSPAVDGSTTTRWSSAYADQQWLYVDLGANHAVNGSPCGTADRGFAVVT